MSRLTYVITVNGSVSVIRHFFLEILVFAIALVNELLRDYIARRDTVKRHERSTDQNSSSTYDHMYRPNSLMV